MKKVLLLFATLFALGQNAFAYDFSVVSPSGHTLIYTIYNGNSVSVACSNNISGALIIPSSVTYNGYTFSVTSIAMNAFEGCTGITSVSIPNSVISIGGSAFERCTGLSAVTIPNSVTFIGEGAFSKCSGLTSITIPNSVTTIGVAAFSDCTWLSSVFFNADSCSLNGPIFARCHLFTSITFGNNVKRIPGYLCENCTSLTIVTIPDSVNSIGGYAFENCSGLTSVTLGSGVTFIGTAAFYQCDHITQMISYAPVPPPLYNGTGFYGVPNNIPVYVPTASISNYQAAPGWSVFTNYIGIVPYAITATSANPTMGSVTGGGTYAGGTTATLTATPNMGYHFVQWQDGNTQNPRTITVTGDATYTATFAPDAAPATVTATISQIAATSAYAEIVMGQQTSYFYLIYAPQSVFTQNGLTTDESIISYVNQNYGSSDRNYNNVSGYMNDLTPSTTYMLVVVPYNSNDEVGTITRKQFTTLNNNGIEDVGEEEYAISSQGGRLTVSGAEGNMVNVYSLDGRCIYSASAKGTTVIDIPASGTYLVKIGRHPARKVVVIR